MPDNKPTRPTDLLGETAARYPALLDALSKIGFRQSPKDTQSRGLEFYPKGEEYSFDPSRPAIEVFGNQPQAKDVAGDLVSHYLGQGADPKLTQYYQQFEQSLSPKQKGILKEQYQYAVQHFGENRSFEDWYRVSGLPAYFRGYAFSQWPDSSGYYTPEQMQMFDQMNEYLRQPPMPPKPNVQMEPISVLRTLLGK